MYIKINGKLYPATVSGRIVDSGWDGRASKAITLEMTYTEAIKLFVDGVKWSIVDIQQVHTYAEDGSYAYDEDGNEIMQEQVTEFDNSEYDVAGSITDNRDGTITAKMGKITDAEALAELREALA